MSKSRPRKQVGNSGFTVLEVIVAIVILTVGVVSVGALAGAMMTTGNSSKYLSLEATLASEKLEDLNRWPPDAPQVAVPSGTSVGSLTSDSLDTTTGIAYYDDVNINFSNASSDCPSSTGGCFAETVATQSGGSTTYITTYHSPDGQITTGSSASAPTNMSFHRNWIIEANAPVTGVRRVTVLVMLKNSPDVRPRNASFQMSMVRP